MTEAIAGRRHGGPRPPRRRGHRRHPLASRLGGAAGLLAVAVLLAACSTTPPVTIEEVPTADVLYQRGLEELEGRRILFWRVVDTTKAVETFQAIIDNYPYSDQAVLAELKIADAYFDDGQYEAAVTYYRDFAELHPRHEQVPYAIYRAALCHYRQARSPERDQTATREALKYLEVLVGDHPDSPYAAEGEELWRELRARLARSVMVVGDFYLKRGEYQAAAERYRDVLNEYPGLGLDAEALYRLGVCYRRMNRSEEASRIFEVILENYRGTDVAARAADLVPAAN